MEELFFIGINFTKISEDTYTCDLDEHVEIKGRYFSRPRKNELITNGDIIFRIIDKSTESHPHKLTLKKITDIPFEPNIKIVKFEYSGKSILDTHPNKFLSDFLKNK